MLSVPDAIRLEANDGVIVEVSRDAAVSMSELLHDFITADPSLSQVDIPNAASRPLRYVVQYMEHHHNNPAQPIEKPLRGDLRDQISQWDYLFLYTDLVKHGDEMQHELLIHVTMAANFLRVKDLIDLCSACTAALIKGKTPEQIRALFNVENDFTPEEEEKIREENRWCEE